MDRKIKNITRYLSIYDLFDNELLSFDTAGIASPGRFLDFLRHVDDYQPVQYFCINSQFVVMADSVNGDVFDIVKIDRLYYKLKAQYREEERNEHI